MPVLQEHKIERPTDLSVGDYLIHKRTFTSSLDDDDDDHVIVLVSPITKITKKFVYIERRGVDKIHSIRLSWDGFYLHNKNWNTCDFRLFVKEGDMNLEPFLLQDN